MKKNSLLIIGLISTVIISFACLASSAQTDTVIKCSNDHAPRIVVSGTGKVTAKPDEATIVVGVTNEDKSLKSCFEKQTSGMNRVIEEVKSAGVDSDDIKSLGYNISPRSKNSPSWWGGAKPDSYQVAHTIAIKVRDITKLGDLIDKVVSSGANNINSLDFGSSRIADIEKEAKVKAVENARAKAEAMAQGAGVRTGKIIEISDAGSPVPVYRGQMKAFTMAAESASPQIEPGSIDVEAGCTLIIEVVQ